LSPFAHHFYELRSRHRISQFALAELLGCSQGLLSSLELGKKLPTDEFLEKLTQILKLNISEADALRQSAKESQRRYALAENATREQFQLVYNLWSKLDQLQPGQMRMIGEVLNFQPGLSEKTAQDQTTLRIKQGGHM
jgi:transcriptional regulator with XRE-family HTH domain